VGCSVYPQIAGSGCAKRGIAREKSRTLIWPS